MSISFPTCIQTYRMDSGYRQSIYFPQVVHPRHKAFEQVMNQAIINDVYALIDQQLASIPTVVEEMIGSYEIKNNQENVLSLTLSNYTYFYQAAHGMTYKKGVTFDLQQAKQCDLKNLFIPGSPYIERISGIIDTQIKQRDIPIIQDFTVIQPNQDFYLADKTLVIFFQLYELTPYVYGFPFFPISVYSLQDILLEDGPLGRLAANK